MNVVEAIKTRKSVRSYLQKDIEDEKLQIILEAGRLAPSASNRQEWRFLIVRNPELKQNIAQAANQQMFIATAPVVLVACAETDGHTMKCGQMSYPIDLAITLDHITLTAVELGLGTCWIGAFNEEKVKEILGIPDEIRVVELMPLGYPSDPTSVEKNRLPLKKIVKYERW